MMVGGAESENYLCTKKISYMETGGQVVVV